jgi:transcriptional regulator GlxA family with amidase domain
MPASDLIIGILLFDGVEELDAVGPYEVLASWTQSFPDDGWAVTTMASNGTPVTGAKGLVVTPHVAVDDAPPLEVLIYPGGRGTRPLMKDSAHLEWVREMRAVTPLLASVCTGSLVFAAAGLLSGRPATTHWGSLELLAETDPSIEVREDERYVDDGDVITASGVSAGIDMALHLVARLASTERAKSVRRFIQYDPLPPV